jgi:hypothetical protein
MFKSADVFLQVMPRMLACSYYQNLTKNSQQNKMVFIGNFKLPNTINGGFMCMFPTNKAKFVLSELNNMIY